MNFAYLPDHSQRFIADALGGNTKAVFSLLVSAPNRARPRILLQLHEALGAGHPAVKEALALVWGHDHRYFISYFGRRLAWQFLKHSGTRPVDLPKTITIWRGGIDTPSMTRNGWSWTTDKRVACFFIGYWERRIEPNLGPCVVRAEVLSSRIVHADNERGEHEVIISGAKNATVDGDLNEWRHLAQDWARERREPDSET